MNSSRNWFVGLTIIAAMACPSANAFGNLLSDASFENAINPLPGLASVVGPPFSPGFWGTEGGGEVPAENGITPAHLQHMLYMYNAGGAVTQTFQAVDVSSFATAIDSGQAIADFRALVNTYLTGQVFVPGLLFYAGPNDWGSHIGSWFGNLWLDSDPATWEIFAVSAPLPVNTRWIVVQLGYSNSYLPRDGRAYVDAVGLDIRIVPEPASVMVFGLGGACLVGWAYLARRRRHRTPR